jgi:HEAT repeat protein/lysophospholipase L1-like esterase
MRKPLLEPRQSLLQNILLSLTVTVVVLGAAEGLARLAEGRRKPIAPEQRPLIWDEGWHGEFYTMRSNAVGWPPWEEFNRDGVRDRTHAKEKADGIWRVVFLGDSVTVGPDGKPNDAYPRILQEKLDGLGPGVEVFNVSLWGWATRQERIAYQRIARPYHPDQVILGICLNDFQDMQNNLSRPPAWVQALYRRSGLVRWVVGAERREIEGVEQLFTAKDSRKVKASFELVFAEIRELRREVQADGARLAVMVFPYVAQVTPAAPPASAQERLAAFCAGEGIPFLDLLAGLSPLGKKAFLEGDGIHLSRAGAERVAEQILLADLVPQGTYRTNTLPPVPGPRPPEPPAVAALVGALGSQAPRARAEAAWALGQLGKEASAAAPRLAKALEDPSEPVRLAAAVALGRLGPEARVALGALERGLGDARQNVRWRCADALFQLGPSPSQAVPLLQAALESPDLYLRGFGAWYLGELGPAASSAVPALARVLGRDDGGVRTLAARSIAKIAEGDPIAIAALCQAISDHDWPDRWRAARALSRMGPEAAAGVPSLAAALGDSDEQVRREAATTLGRIGPAAAATLPLLEGLKADPEPEVRAAAAEATRLLKGGS